MRDYKVESKMSPSVKIVPSLVEDHDWGVWATVEHIYVIVPVHCHIGDLRERPLPGALEESVGYLIAVLAASEGRHLALSPFLN
jgi:hypothetical protein